MSSAAQGTQWVLNARPLTLKDWWPRPAKHRETAEVRNAEWDVSMHW